MTKTFYGYTKEVKPEQLFNLPDSDDSGWCCMIWEVNKEFSESLKRNKYVNITDCPEGHYLVCGDNDKGVADKVCATLKEASAYCFINFDCKHLYLHLECFMGCTKCNCGC